MKIFNRISCSETGRFLIRIFALTWAIIPWAESAVLENDGLVPPRQLEPLWITVPVEIRHLVNEGAVARVAVRVDETGHVVDWVALDLPHYKLWSSVEHSMKYLSFSPAELGGSPIVVDMVIEIPFNQVGQFSVYTLTPLTYIETRVFDIDPDMYQLVFTPPDNLDKPVVLLSRGKSTIPVDADGNRLKGEVEVKFFIDINGNTRMHESDEALDPVLRSAAHMTVEQFVFAKPTCSGNPTVTQARILIKY